MTIEERAEYGAQLRQRMNCCQAVVLALADQTGLPEQTLLSLAAGFGSGMGNMEGTCGALVGAGIAAGLHLGGSGAPRAARQLNEGFCRRSGAMLCKELKGRGTGKVLCSCEDCVRNAVRAYGEVLGLK